MAKKKVVKVVFKPTDPENKHLSKAQYVEKCKKLKERKAKLLEYNQKLIAEEKENFDGAEPEKVSDAAQE